MERGCGGGYGVMVMVMVVTGWEVHAVLIEEELQGNKNALNDNVCGFGISQFVDEQMR